MNPKSSSARLYTDVGLCDSIQIWLSDQETKLDLLYKRGTKEWEDALQKVYQEALDVNGFSWSEMNRMGRYRLPTSISRTIIVFMRRHNIVEKARRNNRDKVETLYEELQIGRSASPKLHPEFICLCRNKVDHFVQAKGRVLKSQGLVRWDGNQIEWDLSTNEWLKPNWNGKVNDLKTRVDRSIVVFEGLGDDGKEGMLSHFYNTLNKDEQKAMIVHCFRAMDRDQQEGIFLSWCKKNPEVSFSRAQYGNGFLLGGALGETARFSPREDGTCLLSQVENSPDVIILGEEIPDPAMKMDVCISSKLGVSIDELVPGDETPVIDSSTVEWDAWLA